MRGRTRVWLTVAAKITDTVNGRKLTPVSSSMKQRPFWREKVKNRNSENMLAPASAIAA